VSGKTDGGGGQPGDHRARRADRAGSIATGTSTRRNLAVYLQNILQPFEGSSLVAGWRFADGSRFGSDHNYRVSAVYRIGQTATKLKATVDSGFKASSLADLFISIPPFSFTNPNLKPEESRSYEIGIEQELWQQGLQFEVTFFRLKFEI
jgi:vitamin B12 transporter